MNPLFTVKKYFNSTVKLLSSKAKSVQWYYDDISKKIILYNVNNNIDDMKKKDILTIES